jgi:hypothetical protein
VPSDLRETFSFLEEVGFRFIRRRELDGVTELAYKNPGAGLGLLVQQEGERTWGWLGTLDAAGRLRPLARDTVELRQWDDLGKAVQNRRTRSAEELAAAVRTRLDRLEKVPTWLR